LTKLGVSTGPGIPVPWHCKAVQTGDEERSDSEGFVRGGFRLSGWLTLTEQGFLAVTVRCLTEAWLQSTLKPQHSEITPNGDSNQVKVTG